MTYNLAPPARRTPGTGADVKTFATAVLLTFGAGLLGMVGWAVLDSGFGGFLGLVGAFFAIFWWRHKHGKVFPREVPAKSVVLLAVVNVVLALILVFTAG